MNDTQIFTEPVRLIDLPALERIIVPFFRPRTCPNCGASRWKRDRCAYCGTERDALPITHQTTAPGVTPEASDLIKAYLRHIG